MDLQKSIVLSSGPFLQIFTFTIQCICSLWRIESSPWEAIPYKQKHDSNKAAAMHLCWNHTTALVPPPPVDSPHVPWNIPKMEHLRRVASVAFTTHSSLILETYILRDRIQLQSSKALYSVDTNSLESEYLFTEKN